MDGKIFESDMTVGSWQSAVDIMKEIEKDEVFYLESGGGVTFSGGEPLLQPYALKQLLELCKLKGYHTAIDTSGHAEPAALRILMKLANLWLFDLKIIDDIKHVEYTGVSNEPALKNLQTLALEGEEIIVRFPLIPGITNGKNNLEAISGLMKELNLNRIDILPYHSIAKDKYRRMEKQFILDGVKEPGAEEINAVVKFFTGEGNVVGVGG
jgi:pyruvate formate lyase activating enzyme